MGDALLRRVLYVSGTRADYGPAKRVLRALSETPGLELALQSLADALDLQKWNALEKKYR